MAEHPLPDPHHRLSNLILAHDSGLQRAFCLAAPDVASYYFSSESHLTKFKEELDRLIEEHFQEQLETTRTYTSPFVVSLHFDDPVLGEVLWRRVISGQFSQTSRHFFPSSDFFLRGMKDSDFPYPLEAYVKAHQQALDNNRKIIRHLQSNETALASGHLSSEARKVANLEPIAEAQKAGLVAFLPFQSGHPVLGRDVVGRVMDFFNRAFGPEPVPLEIAAEVSLHQYLKKIAPADSLIKHVRENREVAIADVISKLQLQNEYNRRVLDVLSQRMKKREPQ